jgi:cell division protein FtsN
LTDGKPKKTRYAILIGVYTSKKELKRWSNALSGLGFSSYVIDQPNGESLLYVGAFYTKAGAEKQRAVLASKGIRSRVAMR